LHAVAEITSVSGTDTAARQQVLILGPAERVRFLAGHLLLLGYRAAGAKDVAAALRMLALASPPIRVGLLASDHGLPDAAEALREIATLAPKPLQWIAIGQRPEASEIESLRGAGARFALFDPFGDEELRFVVSEAHHAGSPERLRIEQRVPTLIRARVTTKTGERVAVVCNLSTLGAYLATPRPAMRGGTLQIRLPLEDAEVELQGLVMWNNVPGNLRRPNVAVGMGVRFTEVSGDASAALERFIAERAKAYRL
jgi:PilZ domain